MWYEYLMLGACLLASAQAVINANRVSDQKRLGLMWLCTAVAIFFMAGAMWQLSAIIN